MAAQHHIVVSYAAEHKSALSYKDSFTYLANEDTRNVNELTPFLEVPSNYTP